MYFNFQVRVRIIKACHLPGINIDPAVRITVDNQKKQTRGKKHVTASKPEFNETFFFNFNEKPDDMFNKLLQIQAINTKVRGRSFFLLGEFFCTPIFIRKQKMISETLESPEEKISCFSFHFLKCSGRFYSQTNLFSSELNLFSFHFSAPFQWGFFVAFKNRYKRLSILIAWFMESLCC